MNTHVKRKNSQTAEEIYNTTRDVYHHLSQHCVKLNDKGKSVLDHNLVQINDKEIVLDVVIFKNNWDLLIRLYKFPICSRVRIVQMAMDAILCLNLTEDIYVDLSDKGVCLVT